MFLFENCGCHSSATCSIIMATNSRIEGCRMVPAIFKWKLGHSALWGPGKTTYTFSVTFRFPLPPPPGRLACYQQAEEMESSLSLAENVYVVLPTAQHCVFIMLNVVMFIFKNCSCHPTAICSTIMATNSRADSCRMALSIFENEHYDVQHFEHTQICWSTAVINFVSFSKPECVQNAEHHNAHFQKLWAPCYSYLL